MTSYEATGADGRVYDIEGPEGLSDQEIISAVQRQIAEEERLAELEPDFIDQIEEFGKGIPSGAIGLLESAALGGAALLSDENEESARETIQSVAASARSPFSADEGSEEAVGRKFGEATGSFVGLGAAALIPGVGVPAAAALAAGAGAGEARERARAGGATYDERATATGWGTLVGLSELIPLAKLKALRKGIGENTLSVVMDRVKRAGVAAGFEGAQEAAAGIAQNLIEQGIYNPEQGTFTDTGEAFGYGAGVGGLVQGLLDLAAPRKRGPDGDGTGDTDETTEAPRKAGARQTDLFDDDLGGVDVASEELDTEVVALEEEQLAEAIEAREGETVTLAGTKYTLPEIINLPLSAIGGWSEVDQAEVARIQSEVQATDVPALRASDTLVEDYTIGQLEAVRRSQERATSAPETTEAEAAAVGEAEAAPKGFPEAVAEAEKLGVEAKAKAQERIRNEEAIRAVNVPKVLAEKPANQRSGIELEAIKRFEQESTGAEEISDTEDLFGSEAETAPARFTKDLELERIGFKPPPEGVTAADVETSRANQEAARAEAEQAVIEKEEQLATVDAANQQVTNREQYEADLVEDTALGMMQREANDLFPIELDQAGGAAETTQEVEIDQESVAAERVRLETYANDPNTPAKLKRDIQEYLAAPQPTTTAEPVTQKRDDLRARIEAYGQAPNTPAKAKREVQKYLSSTSSTAAPEPIKQKVTKKFLGALSVPPSSTFYKRMANRELTLDDINIRLRLFASARSTSAKAKRAIQEYLVNPQNTKSALTKLVPAAQQSMEFQTKQRTPAQMEAARKKKAAEKKRKATNAKARKKRAEKKAAQTEEAKVAEKLVKDGVPSDTAVITATSEGTTKLSKKLEVISSFMGINANPDLDAPLNEDTISLLKAGKVKEALLAMANTLPNTSEFAAIKRNAKALAQKVGETKVIIVSPNPTNQVERIYRDTLDGYEARGVYSFNSKIAELSNVILLDSKLGLNASTLLHEMTHATTHSFIETNPNSPYVKELRKLYAIARMYSENGDTAYGLADVHEFVSEAFGNAAFQEQLSNVPVKGLAASETSVGIPVSVWQKFKNIIHNILSVLSPGSKTVPINSTRLSDEANRVISLILSPAPGQQGVGVLVDSAQYPTEGILQQVNQAYRGASLTPSERTALSKAIAETQYEASNLSLKYFFKTLPMQAMADVAGYYNKALGDLAFKLNTLMLNQRDALSRADAQSTASARQIRNWTKAVWWNPASKKSDERVAEIAMLDNIAGISTVEEVDPRLSKTQAEKKYGKGSDKMVIWQSMRKDWNAIGPEGREVYNNMVKTYAKLYRNLVASLESRLNGTDIGPETRQKLKGVYKKMLQQKKNPYLPLRRSGKYRLAFDAFNKDTNSTEPVFLMFETNVERQDYIDRVLDKDKNVVRDSKTNDPKYDIYNTAKGGYRGAAPSTGFINDLLKAIPKPDGNDKKSQAMEDAIIEGFINALPQTSFAKGFQKRQNIAGFTGQFTGEFANNIYDLNRKIVRMDYSSRILNLQNEIGEVRGLDSSGSEVRQSLLDRADFARNPPVDAWAQTFNRYAFLFTIGFNASSALVNLSQLPLIIYPMLAGRYGPIEASRAMMAASGMITRSGFSKVTQPLVSMKGIESVESRAMPSITNMYTMTEDGNFTVRKGLKLSPEKRAELEALIPLVKAATSTNALVSTSLFDYTGVNQGSTNQSVMDLVTTGSAFMFHSVEQYNRQVTLIATYNLELARVKQEQPKLTTQAQRELAAENSLLRTQEYNGGAVLETASPLAQKTVGRVALMYKGFGIQMYYTLLKATRQFMLGTIDGKKVEGARSEAFKQLMGVHGSVLFFSGVQGLPIYGSIALLGNLILDDDEDSFEELTRKAIGSEAWYKGFASALLGVDISQRVALTNLVFQANRYSSGDRAPEEVLVQAISGPAGSVALQGVKGFEEAISGDGPDSLRRGIERMTPAAIKNGLKAARYSEDDGILTRRKDPILEDITVGQLFAQVAGFAPSDYTKNQEEARNIKRIDIALRTTRSKLLRRNNLARFYGDAEEQASVKKEIEAYNKRISKNFPRARITMGTLGRSRRAFRTQTRKMVNGVQLSENVRRPLVDFMEDQAAIIADFED